MARNDFCSNYLAHSFLAHHGVLGMKWGVRRYQNPDGSLTASEAKKLGYDDSTRLSPEEESAFWKAYAAEMEKKEKYKNKK